MKNIVNNGIRGGNRGYVNEGDRKRAIAGLRKLGFNYFVYYRDTQSDFALNYGTADWVGPGQCYINKK